MTGTSRPPPYVIVVGNEKGGTGKSTTALHLVVGLLKAGHSVGSIDLDARQGTLSRYLANRASFAAETGRALDMPEHRRVERSAAATRAAAEAAAAARLEAALSELSGRQFVVIDTPASDSHLSRLGHAAADTLITPLNDSFLDVDLLAVVDRARREVLAPSIYSRLVWEQNNRRVAANRAPIDWIVMRNRLTHIEARNKREIADLLERLAKRIG
ncbi:MAG: division plane positioning ATPase MipZ, partial [Dongiaceae bacterium]